MKKVIFIFIVLNSCNSFSQKNFEGIITYDGFSTIDSSKFTMKVYYGKNKIKLESVEKGSNTQEENSKSIIFNLEKGIQYTIDTLIETIEIDSLKYRDVEDMEAGFLPTSTTKNILNTNCRLYNAKATIEDSLLIIPQNNLSVWFSENIKFIIPEAYRNKRSLLTLQDGNCIWLEFTIAFKSPSSWQKGGDHTVSNKAILIQHKSLSEAIFALPSNYRITYKEHEIPD